MDTVRYDSFWLPDSRNFTDSFSRWANEAIRFQNVQSTSSWTVPAVASVMSGLYPAQHRAGEFKEPIANLDTDLPSALPEGIENLPKMLSHHNFETQAFVGSPFLPLVLPGAQGLQGVENILEDDQILENAKGWLKRYGSSKTQKPFFLYLHFMAAHDNHWDETPVLQSRNQTLSSDLQKGILSAAPGNICDDPNNYFCLSYQDYVRGILNVREKMVRLLDLLLETGRFQDTVVILFSDHGEEFQDHVNAEQQQGPCIRDICGQGHGQSMYQELLHVPMLVWHPDYSGRDITVPVSLVDLAPTIADWLSLKSPGVLWSGKSLAEIPVLNTRPDLLSRPIFSSGIAFGSDKTAVLWKQWKTIVLSPDVSMMFNILSDPNEKREWHDPGPAFVMDQYVAQYNQALSPWTPNHQKLSEAQLEMIRSIGYLGAGGEP